MTQHIRFPSIEQLRSVVKQVRDRAKFHGVPLPKLTFNGSVKVHGSNSCICYDPYTTEQWCQSREQIITPEQDNAGFARFISELPGTGIKPYFNVVAGIYGHTKLKQGDVIAIYGEWCGQGIMKGVAVNQLSKRFIVFGIKVYTPGKTTEDGQDGGTSVWFSPAQLVKAHEMFEQEVVKTTDQAINIFSIQKFPTWTVEIDFTHPELIQNQLVELTNEVENCCPVGKAFGVEGIGEGIVWRCVSSWNIANVPDELDAIIKSHDLIFKVKGPKHSDTKVKTTATVDIEKVNSINEFAANVCTDHRLEKMLDQLIQSGLELDVKNTGNFLKLVGADILKEESDVIEASGLERKDVMPAVNLLARQWFLTKWNKV